MKQPRASGLANLIVFPLVLRSPSPVPRPPQKAPITPFPLTRRAPLIARAATRMRSMRYPKHAELYLIAVLELMQVELQAAGIDQYEIDKQLIDFALAAKAMAWPGRKSRQGGLR